MDLDPGNGAFLTLDPETGMESGINNLNPQHCKRVDKHLIYLDILTGEPDLKVA